MKTVLINAGAAVIILIIVTGISLRSVAKAGQEEKAACDRQMKDDRMTCGLIEED